MKEFAKSFLKKKPMNTGRGKAAAVLVAILCFGFTATAFAQIDYPLKKELPRNIYANSPFLYLFSPDFNDTSCLDNFTGLYWNENDGYFMHTRYVTKADPKTLKIETLLHNSIVNDENGRDHWVEYRTRVLEIGQKQTKVNEEARRYTTEATYCVGPNRLADVEIRHDFSDDIKILGGIGRPSTHFVYRLWEIVNNQDGSERLRFDIGWEELFHKAGSPYLEGMKEDYCWEDHVEEATLGRKIQPLTFADERMISKPYRELDFARIEVQPTTDKDFTKLPESEYRDLLEQAPLWVFGDNLITQYGPGMLFPDLECYTRQKRHATSSDFEARRAVIKKAVDEYIEIETLRLPKLPPDIKDNNLFNWKKDRANLRNKL